jgi:hypothetical protein
MGHEIEDIWLDDARVTPAGGHGGQWPGALLLIHVKNVQDGGRRAGADWVLWKT